MPHEAIPILRVSNAPLSVQWYQRLGFQEDWRHLRIPRATGHRFHEDLDSDSMRIWTAIPRQPGHLLERGLAGR